MYKKIEYLDLASTWETRRSFKTCFFQWLLSTIDIYMYVNLSVKVLTFLNNYKEFVHLNESILHMLFEQEASNYKVLDIFIRMHCRMIDTYSLHDDTFGLYQSRFIISEMINFSFLVTSRIKQLSTRSWNPISLQKQALKVCTTKYVKTGQYINPNNYFSSKIWANICKNSYYKSALIRNTQQSISVLDSFDEDDSRQISPIHSFAIVHDTSTVFCDYILSELNLEKLLNELNINKDENTKKSSYLYTLKLLDIASGLKLGEVDEDENIEYENRFKSSRLNDILTLQFKSYYFRRKNCRGNRLVNYEKTLLVIILSEDIQKYIGAKISTLPTTVSELTPFSSYQPLPFASAGSQLPKKVAAGDMNSRINSIIDDIYSAWDEIY